MLQALNKQSTIAKCRFDTTFLNCKWLILELRCLSTALISSNLFLGSKVKLTLHLTSVEQVTSTIKEYRGIDV